MKDLGTLHYFLGIKVAYSSKGHLLSQSKYINNFLKQARLFDTIEENSPLKLNVKYAHSDGVTLHDPTFYPTLVDNLVYLTITIPNISYDVHVVSQLVVSPTIIYWKVILHILCYL